MHSTIRRLWAISLKSFANKDKALENVIIGTINLAIFFRRSGVTFARAGGTESALSEEKEC